MKKNKNAGQAAITEEMTYEYIQKIGKGTLTLSVPFLADGAEVKELKFDFLALDGNDYVRAMDRSGATGNLNAFRISNMQAVALFAAAAAKVTDGVDEIDIINGMSIVDAMKAAQVATLFFVASSRVGNARISAE